MTPLKLPRSIYKELLQEAEKEAPLEACGLLAGNDKNVHHFYPMTNVDASSQRYSMDPEEQFKVLKNMRKHGWEILGIWHSHPQTPPNLSAVDRELALMPAVVYVIISLAPAHYGEIKGFRKEAANSFVEERIELL